MKAVYLFFLIGIFITNIYSNNEFEDNFIIFELPNDVSIEKVDSKILEKNGEFVLKNYYIVNSENSENRMNISFPIKFEKDIEKLKKIIGKDTTKKVSTLYGTGNLLEYADKKGFLFLNEFVERFVVTAGSQTTRDLLIYRISIEHNMFYECLVEIFDVWPKERNLSFKFNNQMLDELLKANDPASLKYLMFDEIMTNNFTIKK